MAELSDLLPSVNAWLGNIIAADQALVREIDQLETVEERNEYTQRMTAAANIPRFTWTIDEESGDITVMSEVGR